MGWWVMLIKIQPTTPLQIFCEFMINPKVILKSIQGPDNTLHQCFNFCFPGVPSCRQSHQMELVVVTKDKEGQPMRKGGEEVTATLIQNSDPQM